MKDNKKTKKTNKTKSSVVEIWNKFFSGKISMILMLLTIGITFLANYSAMYDSKLDMNGDNIYYYSLGQAISEGKGFTDIMFFKESPHSHFPPGYPIFVAGVLNIFPNDIEAVKTANGILLFLSILLLFVVLEKITKNRVLAFICALLCCLHPSLLHWATIMMSEMLFLFCSLVIIYLLLILDEKKLFDFSKAKIVNNLLLFLLLLFFCYVYFVRTMGLSLIISVLLWSLYNVFYGFIGWMKSRSNKEKTDQSERRGYFIRSSIVFLLLLTTFGITKFAWDNRNEKIGKTESDYVGDFYMKADGQKMASVDDWVTRAKNNVGSYVTKYLPNSIYMVSFDKNKPIKSSDWIKGISIIALMLVGLFRTKKGGLLFFLYIGVTMGVLLIWPEQYSGERYYTCIIPFYIFLTLNGVAELTKIIFRIIQKSYNPVIVQSLAVILFSAIFLFPAYVKAQEQPRKMANIKSWKMLGNVNLNYYLDAVEWCGDNLPDSARVICRKPEIYYIYSGYHKAAGFAKYSEPDSVMSFLIKNKVTHLIIDNWFKHAYTTLYPAIVKYPEKFKMEKKFGEVNEAMKINPCFVFRFNNDWGYYGERVNGKKEGKGYEIFPDGRKYVGEFSNNNVNGYGALYDSTGNLLVKGYWVNGALVRYK